MNSVYFPPRTAGGFYWLFYLGFGLFSFMGLLILLVNVPVGLATVAFFGGGIVLLRLKQKAVGRGYTIDPSGIIIKRLIGKIRIPFAEIETCEAISAAEAARLLNQYQSGEVAGIRSMNPSGAFSARLRVGRLTRHATVSPVFLQAAAGNDFNIIRFGAGIEGEFVLLRLTDGELRLLSPEDCPRFVSMCHENNRV